jgi:putative transposase
VIAMLAPAYPIALVCEVVGCARRSYYYRGQRANDPALKAAIEAIALEWPTYGYRRVTAQLRRQGWTVNHKRVGRLIGELGLQVPLKARVRKTTQSQHRFPRYPNLVQGLAIVRPDQVWVADIT